MTPNLEAAYAQPHRRYHTRAHIEQCLALLDQVPDLTDTERQILTYAIWWHDAVYDPTASDNEARSAQMAKADLRDFDLSIHAREEVARSLAGVAIAVALVPPLAVSGIGIGWGESCVRIVPDAENLGIVSAT